MSVCHFKRGVGLGMRLVSSSQASPKLDLVSMLSFVVVFVSSEMVKGFDRGKTRISLFFVESPDYFI